VRGTGVCLYAGLAAGIAALAVTPLTACARGDRWLGLHPFALLLICAGAASLLAAVASRKRDADIESQAGAEGAERLFAAGAAGTAIILGLAILAQLAGGLCPG
jgi:hypothetical protein